MKKLIVGGKSYNTIEEMPTEVREQFYKNQKAQVLDALGHENNTDENKTQSVESANFNSQKTVSQVLDIFENNSSDNKSKIDTKNNENQIEILSENFANDHAEKKGQNNMEEVNYEHLKKLEINNILNDFIAILMSFYKDNKYKYGLILFIFLIFIFLLFLLIM